MPINHKEDRARTKPLNGVVTVRKMTDEELAEAQKLVKPKPAYMADFVSLSREEYIRLRETGSTVTQVMQKFKVPPNRFYQLIEGWGLKGWHPSDRS